MAELAVINQLGAALGDTFANRAIVKIHADGDYTFGEIVDELTNLDLTTTPPLDQQPLVYDALSDEWVPGDFFSGLRGEPVADAVALTALPAREFERRLTKDNGTEYVFKLTADLTPGEIADPLNIDDDAVTGKWVDQSPRPPANVAPTFVVGGKWVVTHRDDVHPGILPLDGQTVVNFDTLYPDLWTKIQARGLPMWGIQSFNAGTGEVVLKNYNGQGRFGRAGTTAGVEQADATAPNGLRLRTSSSAGGNVFNATTSMFTNTGNAGSQGSVIPSGDTETRPINVSEIWCIIVQPWTVTGNTADSIDALNDVDTTTIAPQLGEALIFDGANWVPGSGGGGPADTDALPEGATQLYYTDARVAASAAVAANTAHAALTSNPHGVTAAQAGAATPADVAAAQTAAVAAAAAAVSADADVAANTAARHTAVTLGAGSDAALVLAGQELTLTLPAGGGNTDLGQALNPASVEITSSTGNNTTIPAATAANAGVMSAAQSNQLGLIDANVGSLVLPASTTISAFGATLVDDADQATAQATLGVDPAGTDNSTAVTVSGTPDYVTLSGQDLVRGPVNLASHVTGILPIANLSADTPDGSKFLRDDGALAEPGGTWTTFDGPTIHDFTFQDGDALRGYNLPVIARQSSLLQLRLRVRIPSGTYNGTPQIVVDQGGGALGQQVFQNRFWTAVNQVDWWSFTVWIRRDAATLGMPIFYTVTDVQSPVPQTGAFIRVRTYLQGYLA